MKRRLDADTSNPNLDPVGFKREIKTEEDRKPEPLSRQSQTGEIVSYLLSILRSDSDAGQEEPELWAKAWEEAEDSCGLGALLEWGWDGCKAAEGIGSKSPAVARRMLSSFLRMSKKKRIMASLAEPTPEKTLEALLTSASTGEGAEEAAPMLSELVSLISENWADLTASKFACFFIRCLGRQLCGIAATAEEGEASAKKRRGPKVGAETKPEETALTAHPDIKTARKSLLTLGLDFNLFQQYSNDESYGMLVQDFVHFAGATKSPLLDSVFLHGAGEASDEIFLGSWESKGGSRVWEAVISHLDSEAIEQLHATKLRGSLAKLAVSQGGNFPLQALMAKACEEEMVTEVMEELEDSFPDIISARKLGVLAALGEAVGKAKSEALTKTYYKRLLKALELSKPKAHRKLLAPSLLLSGTSAEKPHLSENGETVSFDHSRIGMQGSVMIQRLFKSKLDCEPITSSIQALEEESLLGLCSSEKGSHVLNALFLSTSMSSEVKFKLSERLEPILGSLAMDKYGSRVLENLWAFSSMKQKANIAGNLVKELPGLKENQFGQIIFNKFCLSAYQTSVKTWRSTIAGLQKKKNMLDNFLD